MNDDDLLEQLPGTFVPIGDGRRSHQICRSIGAGAMSIVFFAIDPADGRPAAVKVMRPSFVRDHGAAAAAAARKEAEGLFEVHARRDARHVVKPLGSGSLRFGIHELPWIALEYVGGGADGPTLADRVRIAVRRSGRAFSAQRAARAIEHIVAGLESVHAAKVLHRDVKPSNVLCKGALEDETFVLADFGISKRPDGAGTFGGLFVGTPGHAPPEQASLDPSFVCPQSDVFGLATVIYFVLTGEPYFVLESPADAVWAAQQRSRPSLLAARCLAPELRAEERCRAIDEILTRATNPRPQHRPASARQLGDAVVACLPQT